MRKIALATVALAALAAAAVASPFAGVEAAWGNLGFEVGFADSGLSGYVIKWTPYILSGWWGFGGEGEVKIAGNLGFGGGVLLLIEWEDWSLTDSAWAPYLLVSGSFGSFDVFGKLYYFNFLEEDEPFGAPTLSVGAKLYLDALLAPEENPPEAGPTETGL